MQKDRQTSTTIAKDILVFFLIDRFSDTRYARCLDVTVITGYSRESEISLSLLFVLLF